MEILAKKKDSIEMCYSALVKQDLKYLEKRFGSLTIREQFDAYDRISEENPKLFPKISTRIFPGNYASVVKIHKNNRSTIPMRYGTYPEMDANIAKKYTSYNVRSDNILSSFWSNAFLAHHGFIELEKFFEWVEVKDLLKAGKVNISEVKLEFERQIESRRKKVAQLNKPFKLTVSEKLPALSRKIIIELSPMETEDLLVPVVANIKSFGDIQSQGFAIVTTEPSDDILKAGHDRSPLFITESELDQWLDAKSHSKEFYLKWLKEASQRNLKRRFAHKLAN